MRFSIGGVFAQCSGCGGSDFVPTSPLMPARRDVYTCADCGNQVIYSELVRKFREAAKQNSGSEPN